MRFDALHWLQLSLMMIAAAAGSVSQAMPQWAHICVPIVAGAGGMLSALGLVSGSVISPQTVVHPIYSAPPDAKSPAAEVKP